LADFAAGMRERHGWQPVYWVTQPDLEEPVALLFPDAVRHPFIEANRGRPAPSLDNLETAAFDPSQLDARGDLESMALEVIARHVLANGLSAAGQRAFFHKLLGYCLAVVDQLEIDLFVLNASPHSNIDICFYIAVKLRGGATRILHMTGFSGLQVVLQDVTEMPVGIASTFERYSHGNETPPPLSERGAFDYEEVSNQVNPADPWYVEAQRNREDRFAHLYQAAEFVLDSGLASFHDVNFEQSLEVPEHALGSRRLGCPGSRPGMVNIFRRRFTEAQHRPMARTFARPGICFEGPQITWQEYYTYRDWALLLKTKLRRDYETLSRNFNATALPSLKYVYFPLHYQPEKTTCPEGGRFSDQFIAASILAHSLPVGWQLLIKEHPSQFLWQTEGELGRWEGYYNRFMALPNTFFVPLTLPSNTLISHACAVATITGMAGWEALTRERSVIVFGRPWYAACKGVHKVASPEDAAQAFARIQAGDVPDVESTRRYAAAVEAVGVRCYMNPSHAPQYEDMSDDENCAALIELFSKAEHLIKADPALEQ
jgi:hypothetical protein